MCYVKYKLFGNKLLHFLVENPTELIKKCRQVLFVVGAEN